MTKYLRRNILGVPVANVDLNNIASIVLDLIKTGKKKSFLCANPQTINLYQTNKNFRRAINRASFIFPEGIGTVIASRILRKPLKERTNLLDFIFKVLEYAQSKKWSLYILGGTKNVSKRAVENLKKRFPRLKVNGRDGYFNEQEASGVISEINKAKPKILFVAMGMPKQELWIDQNMKDIDASAFFGVGGAIDIIAGEIPRAPRWVRGIGFEWVYRAYKEPGRLWKRYLIGNTIFLCRVGWRILYNSTHVKAKNP